MDIVEQAQADLREENQRLQFLDDDSMNLLF